MQTVQISKINGGTADRQWLGLEAMGVELTADRGEVSFGDAGTLHRSVLAMVVQCLVH